MGAITKSCDVVALEDYSGTINHISYFNENIRYLIKECKDMHIKAGNDNMKPISDFVNIDQIRLKAKNKYLIEVNKGKMPKISIIYASIEIFKIITAVARKNGFFDESFQKMLDELDVDFCELIEQI